ncbi:MAG TPA: XRE family transcriptional regulator [Deltaproteobacteria bacterium]|nr:XRE family transcriptional regulator [Deltaproteobacteria bacterium]
MTEEEINAAALSDPDCPPLTEEQLSRAVRIVSVKGLRQRLHLTQKEFAERFRLPLGTVRDWEQSRVIPDVAARVLLTLIDRAPKLVEKTLQKSARPPSVFREEFL